MKLFTALVCALLLSFCGINSHVSAVTTRGHVTSISVPQKNDNTYNKKLICGCRYCWGKNGAEVRCRNKGKYYYVNGQKIVRCSQCIWNDDGYLVTNCDGGCTCHGYR